MANNIDRLRPQKPRPPQMTSNWVETLPLPLQFRKAALQEECYEMKCFLISGLHGIYYYTNIIIISDTFWSRCWDLHGYILYVSQFPKTSFENNYIGKNYLNTWKLLVSINLWLVWNINEMTIFEVV